MALPGGSSLSARRPVAGGAGSSPLVRRRPWQASVTRYVYVEETSFIRWVLSSGIWSRVNSPGPGRAGRPGRRRAAAVTVGNPHARDPRRAGGTHRVTANGDRFISASLTGARRGVSGAGSLFPHMFPFPPAVNRAENSGLSAGPRRAACQMHLNWRVRALCWGGSGPGAGRWSGPSRINPGSNGTGRRATRRGAGNLPQVTGEGGRVAPVSTHSETCLTLGDTRCG